MATIIGAVDHADDTHALSKTLKRLTHSDDQIVILGIAPRLSGSLTDHKVVSSAKRAEQAMLDGLTKKTETLCQELGRSIDIDLVSGPPAQKIIEAAILRKADLLIKEDDDLSPDETARRAKVSRTLLQRAPCATLILRNPIQKPAPSVVIAVDKTEDKLDSTARSLLNERVLSSGIEMAKRLGANEVMLLHAWTTADIKFLQHPLAGLSESTINYQIEGAKGEAVKWFAAFRDEVARKFDSSGLTFKTKLVFGEGGKAIAAAAEQIKPDLLVIGSANRRGAQSLFFGNTAQGVLDEALFNLLVIKPADFYELVAS